MANRKLNSITFPDLPDAYYLDADKVQYSDSETYADGSVGKALLEKANTDGYYQNMSVGDADQLTSTIRANDQTPYLFRTAGGSIDIGDREYINGIVGGTIAWNQQINLGGTYPKTQNGVTISLGDNGDMIVVVDDDREATSSFTLTTGIVNVVPNHIYIGGEVTGAWNDYFGYANDTYFIPFNGYMRNAYGITKPPVSGTNLLLHVGTNVPAGTYRLKYQLHDLTQMFGSTIADYIYSLEQTTAGAGVAWFKKLFPKPYYAYNAGQLMSVKALRHITRGFNAWDEEWEVGDIDATTGENKTGNYVRAKNLIPVIPNTNYYVKNSVYLYIYKYGADGSFIARDSTSVLNTVYAIPSDTHYIRFVVASAYGTTYKNDICINLSWDGERDGEYEEYVEHIYELDPNLELRGIPKLSAGNDLYYDGDVYEPNGTVTRKYGIVDLGTLTWTSTTSFTDLSGNTRYYARCNPSGIYNPNPNGIYNSNTLYPNVKMSKGVLNNPVSAPLRNWEEYDYTLSNEGTNPFYVMFTSAKSATEVKTAMNGVYLVYELATPTTEEADPYNGTQIVDDFGTEEFVLSDSAFPIPVGHDTDYPVNLKAKLEMAPDSPSGDGDYIVRQTNGTNAYVPLIIEDALPTIPSTAGSYKLVVTVADGSDPVLSWESEV